MIESPSGVIAWAPRGPGAAGRPTQPTTSPGFSVSSTSAAGVQVEPVDVEQRPVAGVQRDEHRVREVRVDRP